MRKIGIELSKSTILNILRDSGFPPSNRKFEETWLPFLRSHAKRVFACNFVTVETAFLRTLYVFAVIDESTRQIVATAVTANPTAIRLEQVFRSCLMVQDIMPDFIVSDRDGIYGEWLGAFLKDCYDTLREELLDRRLFFGCRDLQRVLTEYVAYYIDKRPQQSLNLDAPTQSLGTDAEFDGSRVRRKRLVDGLVVDYSLAA